MKMMKLLLAAVSAAWFCGCSNIGNNHLTLKDFGDHLADSGLHIEQVQPLAPAFDSDTAAAFQIAGMDIGVYKYNVNIPKQAARLKYFTEKKCLYIKALKFPLLVNGSFVVIGYEKNPRKHEIIRAVASFRGDQPPAATPTNNASPSPAGNGAALPRAASPAGQPPAAPRASAALPERSVLPPPSQTIRVPTAAEALK